MKTLFGLTCDSFLRQTPDLEEYSTRNAVLMTPLYGTHEAPYMAGYNERGITIEHTRFPVLNAAQYIEAKIPFYTLPDLGEPYALMVVHPQTGDVAYHGWDHIATYLCSDGYAAAKCAALHDGLDGYHLARFITRTAPKHASGGKSNFDVRKFRAEIAEMGLICAALEKAHPDYAHGLTPTVGPTPIEIGN